MKTKYFFLGFGAGVVLTFIALFIIGSIRNNSETPAQEGTATETEEVADDPIDYLDQPVSYEGKKQTSFKVFQVLGPAALANEISNAEYDWYHGNTVLILGEHYYTDQVIKVKEPMRIGTYSYTTKNDMPLTVPVIDGTIIE